jgi:hypothetical protein
MMSEQQRRWWFATHPEYSSGSKRKKPEPVHEDDDSDKMSPEEVDAWANEALKYERDPFQIVLLTQAKYWFGTEFSSKSPEERHALLWGTEAKAGSDEEPEDEASFGGAYGWAKDNPDKKPLRSIWDYWFYGGPAVIKPVQAKFPSASEMARRLRTTVDDWHHGIKEEIKTQFSEELKKLGESKNFDVGVDQKGNIVLKNKQTGKEMGTNVPLKNYSR